MKIFEEMLSDLVIDRFIKHKEVKLKYSKDSDEFIKMKNYLKSDEYKNDVNRLVNGDYYISVPRRIKVKKINSSKRRVCYLFKDKEMYLFKLMTYVLMYYDYLYEDSLYSYRKFQSHRDFFKKLKSVDRYRKLYVLKIDIRGYGESLDQDILLDKFKTIFKDDPDYYNFIHWLLKRNKYIEKGVEKSERISIQPGTPMGAFFNNIYLADLDTYVKKNSILYMRFADDIGIFVDNYKKAEELEHYIYNYLKDIKLEMNENKTHIYKPEESFAILGIDVAKDGYDIAKESYRKILFKLNHRLNRLLFLYRTKKISSEKAIELYMNFINRHFFGDENKDNEINWTAWAFGVIDKIDTLKKLDNCVQKGIRSIITKKKSKVKYKIKYDDIKKLGYTNLVHSYYHDHKK